MSLFIDCRTKGDGNCLYRACSKLLCGKEDLWNILRDLTSIELFNNQQFYAFHPFIKDKAHIFHSENTAFSAAASDGALADGYDRKDASTRTVVVQREALRNAVSGSFSSLLCMMALTSVTGMRMTTVYPENSSKESKYSKFMSGTILPRAAHNLFSSKLVQDVQLIIMWSMSGITILPGVDTTFQPNHFVPLVKLDKTDGSSRTSNLKEKQQKISQGQQRKITDVLVSCGKNKDTVTAVSRGWKGIDFKSQSTFNLSLGDGPNLVCILIHTSTD